MFKTEHRESSLRDLLHADAAGRTAASQLSGSRRSPHWGRSLIPPRMGFRQFNVRRGYLCPDMRSQVRRFLQPDRPSRRALTFLCRVLLHDGDVSVCLVGNHFPASSKARQNRRFGPALRQEHKTVTFLGMSPAAACFVCFASGIKRGHWRPARYTRSAATRARDRSRSQSTNRRQVPDNRGRLL